MYALLMFLHTTRLNVFATYFVKLLMKRFYEI